VEVETIVSNYDSKTDVQWP